MVHLVGENGTIVVLTSAVLIELIFSIVYLCKIIFIYPLGYLRICIDVIFGGKFLALLKRCRSLYFPATSGGSLSLPSALLVRSILTQWFDFASPWKGFSRKASFVVR